MYRDSADTQYMITQKNLSKSQKRSTYNNVPFILECFMTNNAAFYDEQRSVL